MSGLFRTSRLTPSERRRLGRLLRAGPWCWPDDGDPAALALARHLAALDGPPCPLPATAPVVSVSDRGRATLWIAHLEPDWPPCVGLDATIDASWWAAGLALQRALPVIWGSLREVVEVRPRLLWADTLAADDDVALPEEFLRGPSFGLAFALLAASRLTGLPVRPDVVASAAITPDGRVWPVDALGIKLRAVAALAPRVRLVLVAAEQAGEAQRDAPPSLKVVGVGSVAEAIDVAFGTEEIARALADAGRDAATRRALVHRLLALVLQGRNEFVDWAPVTRGAALARAEWPSLDEADRWTLAFVQAVALRHEVNRGVLDLPPARWFEGWPQAVRCQIGAHLVQHCADTGTPPEEAIRAFVAPLRAASVREAFAPQLMLEGALARLDAITGRPREALACQLALARAHLEGLSAHEVSFPLTEAYRLAAALECHDAFGEAETLRQLAAEAGAFGATGNAYVTLARARALVALGRRLGDESGASLEVLATDHGVPAHVRWAALRWWHRATREHGATPAPPFPEPAPGVRDDLSDDASSHSLEVQRRLTDLDRALRAGDDAGAAAAVDALRMLEPAIVTHLARGAGDRPLPSYVARFFPY